MVRPAIRVRHAEIMQPVGVRQRTLSRHVSKKSSISGAVVASPEV